VPPPAEGWSDEVDEVLDGDLTTGLGYVTPAGGVVISAVAPLGLRDRDAGTVTFTTSLGFGKKLERMKRNPRVALAYHAREQGFSGSSLYVLVQGMARPTTEPSRDYLERVIQPAATRFMGPPKEGVFWDRWLQAYYADRVPVEVQVERVRVLPGDSLVSSPPSQSPPKKGVEARVKPTKLTLPHRLLGWVGEDGFPELVPFDAPTVYGHGFDISSPAGLPEGERRAGVLAHDYRAQLVGIESRQHTGWLTVEDGEGFYSPHTVAGFKAPANKTLLLLANGFMARRGLKKARKEARAKLHEEQALG
jgi:hypothetical protein